MADIVFLEPNKIDSVPFTTSDVIAEMTEISYRSVQRTIEKQKTRLEKFGRVRFEITTLQTKGGAQNHKVYRLNEEQATLLITFMKNNDKVADFKVELVRQFYAMRKELMSRQTYRAELKPIRKELCDIIRETDGSQWAYKKYTDLAYKYGIGKNAAQLRRERGADKKASAVDYMTSGEIAAVAKRQSQIAVLLDMGMGYQDIKNMVSGHVLCATKEAAS